MTHKKITPLLLLSLTAGVCVCSAIIARHGYGLHIVLTPSVPRGIWRETQEPITRGVYVAVCLPAEYAAFGKARGYLAFGWCEGWTQPVLKPVVAIGGDVVDVDAGGITVNGALVQRSAALMQDSRGRALSAVPAGRYVVKKDTVWIVSGYNAASWDSRYFNAVPTNHIVSTARLFLLWEP